jgi:hypothetical protein
MEISLVIFIIFVVFLIRSTFGFGDALTGMPLLVIIIGVQAAAPLLAMLALLMAFLILLKNRQQVSFNMSWKLVLSALAGVPVGLFYLSHLNQTLINILLAVFIITFAGLRLLDIRLKSKSSPLLTYLVGFVSGILGGAYNTNGPPVIMLLSAQNWTAAKFRSTLQSYFFFTGVGLVAGHIAWGNVTAEVLRYSLYGLPALFLAFFLGEFWFRKFNSAKFYRWVYILMILIGAGLIAKVTLG